MTDEYFIQAFEDRLFVALNVFFNWLFYLRLKTDVHFRFWRN